MEANSIVKLSDLKKADTNPFLDETKRSMLTRRKGVMIGVGNKALVDPDSGEMSELKMIGKFHEVDQEEFVKIFRSRVSNIFELTKTGNKVLAYIITKMEKNTDEIYIYIQDLMQYCGWTQKRQAYSGLAELAAAQIIYPATKTNIWYINPNVLFNGDRIAFIDAFAVKRNGKSREKPPAIPENRQFEEAGDYVKARPAE